MYIPGVVEAQVHWHITGLRGAGLGKCYYPITTCNFAFSIGQLPGAVGANGLRASFVFVSS